MCEINKKTPRGFESKRAESEYWYNRCLETTPKVNYTPEYNPVGFPDIKALFFEGVPMGDYRTKVFAFIGFPKDTSKPVPAVVLQHGGQGYAFPQWVKIWNDRGYAAIAVTNTGYKPAHADMTEFYSPDNWTHTLTEDELQADERRLTPDNNTTELSAGEDVTQNWMFHAVADTILAGNILRADDRIDHSKIGLTGISWGGTITALVMGFDTRYAFYIPIYGCAHLGESQTHAKDFFTPRTLETFDATPLIKKAKAPVLWLLWAEDVSFDTLSCDKTYADTAEHAVFAPRKYMGHSHDLGWLPLESYRFADWAIGRGERMTTFAQQPDKYAKELSLKLDIPSDAKNIKATLYYITQPELYINMALTEPFRARECAVKDGKVTVTVPDEARIYYIEVSTDWENGAYSTGSRFVIR